MLQAKINKQITKQNIEQLNLKSIKHSIVKIIWCS